jgi:hypothetical protein
VPLGYNNPHHGPPPSSLLPPPIYHPAESPTESRHSAPDTVPGFDTGPVAELTCIAAIFLSA